MYLNIKLKVKRDLFFLSISRQVKAIFTIGSRPHRERNPKDLLPLCSMINAFISVFHWTQKSRIDAFDVKLM